ncbi:MAG: metal-dependent transcriptional regulator [Spirochaetes bacterium]|nr:metal-dependent transcriptional regulator [Spirochaetota bacterium]
MTQSVEDYLEAVYLLSGESEDVRVTDLSARLSVKKPSVVHALKTLTQKNFVKREHYGTVRLTTEGYAAARKIFRRHTVIKQFLISALGESEENAEKDACALEHILSNEALVKIARFGKRRTNDTR